MSNESSIKKSSSREPGLNTPDFASLPKYYGWKDIAALYGDDEDRLVDAYCDGTLPPALRHAVNETVGPQLLQTWLLRKLIRQQTEIIRLLSEPAEPFQ